MQNLSVGQLNQEFCQFLNLPEKFRFQRSLNQINHIYQFQEGLIRTSQIFIISTHNDCVKFKKSLHPILWVEIFLKPCYHACLF